MPLLMNFYTRSEEVGQHFFDGLKRLSIPRSKLYLEEITFGNREAYNAIGSEELRLTR